MRPRTDVARAALANAGHDTRAPQAWLGVIEALDAANRKSVVVGINGTKEAVDAIKAGKLLASGQADPFMQGCLGGLAALRHLRNQPVPNEMHLKPSVIDSSNYQQFDVPVEARTCPKWGDAEVN